MNKQIVVKALLVTLVFVASVGVSSAQGQGATSIPLKIRKFNALGTRALVETPQVKSNVARSSGSPKKWHTISVLYDTSPEWLDEITVEFHILSSTKDPETKKKVFSLYKLVVRYMDIERGRGHTATAFLRPTALKRYGQPIAVATVFSAKGKVIDFKSEKKR